MAEPKMSEERDRVRAAMAKLQTEARNAIGLELDPQAEFICACGRDMEDWTCRAHGEQSKRWRLEQRESESKFPSRRGYMGAHKGRLIDSGPEYGFVWECDTDCPADHDDLERAPSDATDADQSRPLRPE